MTGPEHYRKAEQCRERAAEAQTYAYDNGGGVDGWKKAAYWNAAAQVHATLALAAATAEPIAESLGADSGDIRRAWSAAIS